MMLNEQIKHRLLPNCAELFSAKNNFRFFTVKSIGIKNVPINKVVLHRVVNYIQIKIIYTSTIVEKIKHRLTRRMILAREKKL